MKPGHLKEWGGVRACQCILDSRTQEGEGGDGRRSEDINPAVKSAEANAILAINLPVYDIKPVEGDDRRPRVVECKAG